MLGIKTTTSLLRQTQGKTVESAKALKGSVRSALSSSNRQNIANQRMGHSPTELADLHKSTVATNKQLESEINSSMQLMENIAGKCNQAQQKINARSGLPQENRQETFLIKSYPGPATPGSFSSPRPLNLRPRLERKSAPGGLTQSNSSEPRLDRQSAPSALAQSPLAESHNPVSASPQSTPRNLVSTPLHQDQADAWLAKLPSAPVSSELEKLQHKVTLLHSEEAFQGPERMNSRIDMLNAPAAPTHTAHIQPAPSESYSDITKKLMNLGTNSRPQQSSDSGDWKIAAHYPTNQPPANSSQQYLPPIQKPVANAQQTPLGKQSNPVNQEGLAKPIVNLGPYMKPEHVIRSVQLLINQKKHSKEYLQRLSKIIDTGLNGTPEQKLRFQQSSGRLFGDTSNGRLDTQLRQMQRLLDVHLRKNTNLR